MFHIDSCKYCMCLQCPRLLITKHRTGQCDTCKNCNHNNPFVDIRKGEFCVWREEYEKQHNKQKII